MNRFAIGSRLMRVWRRNLLVYRKTWAISFIPPLTEPLLYLAAFGLGVGRLVGTVSYGGATIPYTTFIAPGLIAITVMQGAFFETTYSSFVRMYYQKTFDAMLATPLTLEEVIAAEILWGGTKSVIGTILMMIAITPFGLLSYPSSLLLLPIALLGGVTFGALGMLFTALVPTIETFNLPIFLFITPMFLFSGAFFPLDTLPPWGVTVARLLPLTPLTDLCRSATLAAPSPHPLPAVLYLALLGVILVPLSIAAMEKRLIR
ncbi:MAG: ABC transporter permease [Desulfuromonadia bacterium]